MPPYKEQFPAGTRVRVKPRPFLEQFQRGSKHHNPLSVEQLDFADVMATVKTVGFYHGGDVLYTLSQCPGIWHEECLEST